MTTFIRTFVRIPEDLHARLRERATAERRSLNGQIIWLLQRALDAGL
jgi:predicted HicB family RNase H-like nuclease